MQVNEEIDALKTLGVSPMDFLVLPRMLALVIMMPILCVYADIMRILGVLIALSGCLQGMQCGRSASAVGEATTSAVVTSIVAIVVATAIITFAFN